MNDLVDVQMKVHPLVLGLIQSLPPPGTIWASERRALWMDVARNCIDLIYHDAPEQQDTPR